MEKILFLNTKKSIPWHMDKIKNVILTNANNK